MRIGDNIDDGDDDDDDDDVDDEDIFLRLRDFSLLDGQYMMYIILIHLNLTCQNLNTVNCDVLSDMLRCETLNIR